MWKNFLKNFKILKIILKRHLLFLLVFGGMGFELWALHLLDKLSVTWAMPLALCLSYFPHGVLILPGTSLRLQSSYVHLLQTCHTTTQHAYILVYEMISTIKLVSIFMTSHTLFLWDLMCWEHLISTFLGSSKHTIQWFFVVSL
jgi:hypothetical protein